MKIRQQNKMGRGLWLADCTWQQLPRQLTLLLRNKRSKNPRWGGGGGRSSRKSGVGSPFGPNTFSSLKHSVSNICKHQKRGTEMHYTTPFVNYINSFLQTLKYINKELVFRISISQEMKCYMIHSNDSEKNIHFFVLFFYYCTSIIFGLKVREKSQK